MFIYQFKQNINFSTKQPGIDFYLPKGGIYFAKNLYQKEAFTHVVEISKKPCLV